MKLNSFHLSLVLEQTAASLQEVSSWVLIIQTLKATSHGMLTFLHSQSSWWFPITACEKQRISRLYESITSLFSLESWGGRILKWSRSFKYQRTSSVSVWLLSFSSGNTDDLDSNHDFSQCWGISFILPLFEIHHSQPHNRVRPCAFDQCLNLRHSLKREKPLHYFFEDCIAISIMTAPAFI